MDVGGEGYTLADKGKHQAGAATGGKQGMEREAHRGLPGVAGWGWGLCKGRQLVWLTAAWAGEDGGTVLNTKHTDH